jgi:transposase-like protein
VLLDKGCVANATLTLEVTTMTDDMIALRELLEKGSDATLELEAETACGAGHGERSESRTNLRNGYRDRDWHTRVGTVELRIPKLRKSLPLRRRGAAIFRAFWSHVEWRRRR